MTTEVNVETRLSGSEKKEHSINMYLVSTVNKRRGLTFIELMSSKINSIIVKP